MELDSNFLPENRQDTDNAQGNSRREGTVFTHPYHFRPITNIETIICNFTF